MENEFNVEIMAPAGSYESLMAAINAGATSIYFGIGNLNMRSKSANFEFDDLVTVAGICEERKVRSYLTLNTIMYDEDLDDARRICDLAKKAKLSAIIASDISVIEYAGSIGLEVHISTQANISNVEAVRFYSRYADVVVLARELSLEQIKHICDEIETENICGPSGSLLKIEVFIHGAMCVAISGKCYMSLAQYNSSANRGRCLQTCRRRYRVTDEETNEELVIDDKFVMSPKDLCTIKMLDRLIDAGVTILKIEGRARGPEYVDVVVRQYKKALDQISAGEYDEKNKEESEKELKKVFNRGFWENGYYLGKKLGEWSGVYGSQATEKKIQIGKVINFYRKNMVVHFAVESEKIKIGDEIAFTGPTTGIAYSKVDKILDDDGNDVTCIKKGNTGTIKLNEVVRRSDKLFLIKLRTDK
ncbi:MAG: U32 family peptidase [Candidatus Sabulitectum sp.]|nr:U32 family peptidase [Candidatus Sabulitectum sp.]